MMMINFFLTYHDWHDDHDDDKGYDGEVKDRLDIDKLGWINIDDDDDDDIRMTMMIL